MVLDYVRYYAPTSMVFWVGASSGSWSDTANWLQSRTPGSGDEVVFSYLTVANSSIALGQDTAIGGLAIQESGPVSISSRTLTINSGGINMLSALYDGVINSSVNLGAAQTWGCRWQKRYRIRPGRGGGSSEQQLSSPVTGDPLAWEPEGASPAASSQHGLHCRSSPRYSLRGWQHS